MTSTKRAAIYGLIDKPILMALRKGFRQSEIDSDIFEIPYLGKFNPVIDGYDIFVLNGLKENLGHCAKKIRESGKQLFIVDFGYLDRVCSRKDYFEKNWLFGVDRIGWHPDIDVPDDRLKSIKRKVKIDPITNKNRSNKIYIIGQKAYDSVHKMNEAQLGNYYSDIARSIKSKFQNRFEVVFRDHPLQVRNVNVLNFDSVDKSKNLEDLLIEAHCIVTINSTTGLDAIRLGCPVVTTRDCYYSKFSTGFDYWIKFGLLKQYEEEEIYKFFRQLSYAQWTYNEIRTGDPVKFLLKNGYMKK